MQRLPCVVGVCVTVQVGIAVKTLPVRWVSPFLNGGHAFAVLKAPQPAVSFQGGGVGCAGKVGWTPHLPVVAPMELPLGLPFFAMMYLLPTAAAVASFTESVVAVLS